VVDYMPSRIAQVVQETTEGENMLSVEIRFLMQGREVSVDSLVEAIVREVRASVREEIGRTFPKHEQQGSDPFRRVDSAMPRQAVSVREAARLLSISPSGAQLYWFEGHSHCSGRAARSGTHEEC
jgi:hypothetical protein